MKEEDFKDPYTFEIFEGLIREFMAEVKRFMEAGSQEPVWDASYYKLKVNNL